MDNGQQWSLLINYLNNDMISRDTQNPPQITQILENRTKENKIEVTGKKEEN